MLIFCADFFLIQERQVVPCGMVVGPNGSRGGAAIGPAGRGCREGETAQGEGAQIANYV